GFEFGDSGGGAREADYSEFFDALFRRRGGGSGRSTRRGAGLNVRGEDHHAKILVDLDDAFTGATRTITLQVPTFAADGRVTLGERQLEVRIPKGIRAGQQLRLPGQGGPGLGEGTPGDLYLELEFRPHRLYRVDGGR